MNIARCQRCRGAGCRHCDGTGFVLDPPPNGQAGPAATSFDDKEASTMPSGSWTIAHLERTAHRRRRRATIAVFVLCGIIAIVAGVLMALHR